MDKVLAIAITLVFVGFVVVFIGGLIWYSFLCPEARTRRRLRGVSTRIDQVEEGVVVKIVGQLRYTSDQEPLRAPITTRDCAYFRVHVTEGQGKHRETVLDDEQSQAFILDDGTGRALVQVTAISFVVEHDRIVLSADDEQDRVMRYIAANAARARGTWDGQTRRTVKEFLLREGDKVAVMGQAAWEPDPEPGAAGQGYRQQARRVVIRAPEDGKVHVSDDRALC